MRYGVPGASRPCMVAAGYGRESSGISAGLAPGMGGVFNTTNCHLYHYAGNNPVRYVDPEGRVLELYLNKQRQTLTIMYKDNKKTYICVWNSSSITTRVAYGAENRNLLEKTSVLQGNNTHPTQFPNGVWNIDGIGKTSDAKKYGVYWLTTDASQMLDVYDSEWNPVPDEDGNKIQTRDSGYFIHFTGTNTHGCLGILDKTKMKILLTMYKMNLKTSDPTARIYVFGDPTLYAPTDEDGESYTSIRNE